MIEPRLRVVPFDPDWAVPSSLGPVERYVSPLRPDAQAYTPPTDAYGREAVEWGSTCTTTVRVGRHVHHPYYKSQCAYCGKVVLPW